MARSPLPDLLLRFTPHIPDRPTATGWTAERQIAFIAALARMGVVRAAAESVGMSARSAYQLRARVRQRTHNLADVPMTPEQAAALGPGYVYSFAAAWDLALDAGLQLQMEAALPVALVGERTPVIRRGRIIGWQHKYNMRLAIAALGAWRRSAEGSWYDHEVRTAERTHVFAEKIEALFRRGPAHWPELAPAESREERLARQAREREEKRIYGPRSHGLLDAMGPADRPPRTLAQIAEEAAAARRSPAPPRAASPRVQWL
ncbi:MAG: hypothetical protein J7500_08845 [Sphingomonas sp.]|uniref:hypothetical protein n=1 Tax=Sphingomonas sp. TaxID=28214 RepID=UPI001B28411B|nr:hypothetical protein [Sphingomonas sp.]MBO9622807.1 hypothetical protein [Sphingomonas sp.]